MDSALVSHTVSYFLMATRVRRNAVAPIGCANHKWLDGNRNHSGAAVRLSLIFNLIPFGLEGMPTKTL